jgi:hypothetical protein
MQINYMENAIVPNLTLKIRTKYEHVPFPWLEEYLGGSRLLFRLHTKDPPPPT